MTGCSVSGSVWAEWSNSGLRRRGRDGERAGGGVGKREKEKLVRQTEAGGGRARHMEGVEELAKLSLTETDG